jgi:hypothetical protein
MKKLLAVGVIVLFLGLACAPSINANFNKEPNNKSIFSDTFLGWSLKYGFSNPSITIGVWTGRNETYEGNVSCILDIIAPIMIYGCSINVTDFYVNLGPNEEEIIYQGQILGFGLAKVILDMPYPVNVYTEFNGILLFFFLFIPIWLNWCKINTS